MTTALQLLGLLLIIASARAAAGLPLELPGTLDAHGSEAPPQGLMGILSMSGCARFADLVAATAEARDIFEERFVADGGLTVFCPDDKAVAEFEATFCALAEPDRLAVLLLHGVAARYGPAHLAALEWVEARTLAAADAATNKSTSIIIRRRCLWPSPSSCKGGTARITKTASSEEGPHPVAVYLIDAVLVPCQKLDGEDEAASGGYLGWLDSCIPVSTVLSGVGGSILGHVGAAWVLPRMPWNRVQ